MKRSRRKDRAKPGAVRLMEAIFLKRYRPGAREVVFTTSDVKRANRRIGLDHLPDIAYRFKQGRSKLPAAILKTAPEGQGWIVESIGKGRYRFVLYPMSRLREIEPDRLLQQIKIPNATPGLIAKYARGDEQSALAILRYNRLLDIFTGVTCFSLQSHLKSTLKNGVEAEIDELYLGVDHTGSQYAIPVEAKGEDEKLRTIQSEQAIRLCQEKWPELVCRAMAAQKIGPDAVALFELTLTPAGVRKVRERHYRLVPPDQITESDLIEYRRQLPTSDSIGR